MLRYLLFVLLLLSENLLNAQNEVIVRTDSISDDINEKIYVVVDQRPEFPGGSDSLIAFFEAKSKFEVSFSKEGCSSIFYNIVIDTLGNVEKYKVIRGINEIYNAETERVVKLMPLWKSGIKNGKVVKTLITLEMRYRLND